MLTKGKFCSLFLLIISQQLSHCYDEDVIPVYQITKNIINGIDRAWTKLGQSSSDERQDKTILIQMEEITQQLYETEDYDMLQSANETVKEIQQIINGSSKINDSMLNLIDAINNIEIFDENFRFFIENINVIDELARDLEEFVTNVVSIQFGIENFLEDIHTILAGSSKRILNKPALLVELLDHMEHTKNTTCSYGFSAQQIILQLYNAVSITELKGYSVMQFSWMLLSTYGKGNFATESKLSSNAFKKVINKIQNLLQQVIKRADSQVWRCDPSNNRHVEDSSYLQVTRLLQGYVENEVNFNSQNTCSENCQFYQHEISQISCYPQDLNCSKHGVDKNRCNGKMYDCQYVDSDMWICPASTSSNRRYEYIEYESGRVLGEKKYCKQGTKKVDSWWRWLFWHCSFCFCVCDDVASSYSDRFISLRKSVADIRRNMVVTGVRFVKKNRIIHLQIQQGKLLPRGRIDNTTLEWVEPSNFSILDTGIQNGIDYHTFSYHDRAINLDDVKGPDGYVITGLRFKTVENHLDLEATARKIDYKTGNFFEPREEILIDEIENNYETRTEIKLTNPHIPIKTISPSIPLSKSNQFIKLQASDFEKDASQTTVPFFDAQPCVTSNPTPLSGIGLFVKGQHSYGGFITPKIFSYNLNPYV